MPCASYSKSAPTKPKAVFVVMPLGLPLRSTLAPLLTAIRKSSATTPRSTGHSCPSQNSLTTSRKATVPTAGEPRQSSGRFNQGIKICSPAFRRNFQLKAGNTNQRTQLRRPISVAANSPTNSQRTETALLKKTPPRPDDLGSFNEAMIKRSWKNRLYGDSLLQTGPSTPIRNS